MTFKHGNLSDSPTFRALEKIAQQKGLAQPNPHQLAKYAATQKPDLQPSQDFTDNLLKLCHGLRQGGFQKEAHEIEQSFLACKAAGTYYDVSDEEGKDLVEFAHPEGGHQMENVEGDAYIEDILEKHLKMVDVSEKEPKGKLSSSQDVLRAVKKALGAPPLGFQEVNLPSAPTSYGRLMDWLGKSPSIELGGETAAATSETGAAAGGGATAYTGAGAAAVGGAAILASAIAGGMLGNALFEHYFQGTNLEEVGNRVLSEVSDVQRDLQPNESVYVAQFTQLLSDIRSLYPVIGELQHDPSAQNVSGLKKLDDLIYQSRHVMQNIWSMAQSHNEHAFFRVFGGWSDVIAAASNYMQVAEQITAAIDDFLTRAAQIAAQHVQQQTSSTGGQASQNLLQQFNDLLGSISKYQAVITASNPANSRALLQWLGRATAILQKQQTDFQQVSVANRPAVVNIYTSKLNDIKQKLDAFAAKWVKQ